MTYQIITKNNVRERFKSQIRPKTWESVPDSDWNNWIWQQQKRVKTIDQLKHVVRVSSLIWLSRLIMLH